MSHHHGKKQDLSWRDIAGLLTSAARLVTRFTRWSNSLLNTSPADRLMDQQMELNAQRLENLKLDARRKSHQASKESNHVVMTDARAELDRVKMEQQILKLQLQNLELQKKLEAAGLLGPNFTASHYAEPGDVRKGTMYESTDNNQFTPDAPRS